MKKRYFQIASVVALILVVSAVAFFPFYGSSQKASTQVIFSDFMDLVESGQIAGTAIFNENTHTIYFHVTSGQHLRTVYSKEATEPLQELLKKKGLRFAIEPPAGGSIWLGLLFNFLPFLVIIGLFVMMGRRSQMGGGGGPMSFGKSKAKLHDATKPKVTFADVAGEEEPKEELLEVIEFLKHPQKYQVLHAKIPRGLLLVGPPGCGKTLLAKAVAGEAGVPFFSLSGSEFVEVFVGVGASRVRDLFEQAKKNAPCLVFIDEIDAVGRHRGAGLGGGNDEREQTLNQLLVAMDGFEDNMGIIVIAATNRPDILDPALLRPGRFDRRIIVDNPDSKGRKAILEVHLREIPVGPDVNVDVLAKQTPGFSGADLASVVNEGALLAARRDKDRVSMVDFDEAVERVIAGPLRRSRALTPKEREMVAYHEAGHAILRKLLPKADPPHKVTIVSRGMALGYVMGAPPEDRYTRTRSELLAEVSVGMGGRVAEDLIFGEITTGASNDFEQATGMVRRMVTNFGMSDKLGPVTLGRSGGPVFLGRDMIDSRNYSEEIAYQIDQEVRRIIDECYQVARQTIEANREKLVRVAKALIERETLFAEELDDVMAGKVVALEPSRPTSVEAGPETAAVPTAPSASPPA
ncbi:ATP-dependent zinc metalloprotease FtsH [Candidatus Methylomirabilis sp.]|uniref:ATP-dependent zinc metalloprotease FtsH n=1 Tax=Candidatus Methylomirabilis sp. TaxID=2032687 RepID=UPI002A61BE4B|nr:ATP-dependent zinc metalloprotease FtsH [Candidatus Methylomirabilis sp.]